MTGTRSRPFTLVDAMILVAATAASFALGRDVIAVDSINSSMAWCLPEQRFLHYGRNARYDSVKDPIGRGYRPMSYWTQRLALWPCPMLAAWTVATLGLTFLCAHPLSHRLLRRPGALAGVAFIVALAGTAAVFPQTLIERRGGQSEFYRGPSWATASSERPAKANDVIIYGREWWIATCFALPRTAAFAVGVAWLALVASGRWRMGSGWLDRSGVVLGASWIFLGSVGVISSWLTSCNL
jgi:hypothetical protein